MIYKCANAYYFRYINKIGGIESHLYYISKKYGNYDITIFYTDGDQYQIYRLKKFVRCVKLDFAKDSIECENLFCCFNREVLDICKAKTKYLVLHGDYKDMIDRGQLSYNNLPMDSRIDKYIGVSQLVCDSWKEVTGIEAKNVYEPVVLDEVDQPLIFVSATRLGKEKGWDRMKKLSQVMEENHVNYLWYVYTDTKQKPPTNNMIFLEPRLDITDKLGAFDAFIQLSDNEGFCLSVVEALLRGTPIICTDLPVLKELGVNESNSIKIDMDMKNIPIDKIKDIWKMKFEYHMPEDKWCEVLAHAENFYKGEVAYKVRATKEYKKRSISDAMLGRIPAEGEVFLTTKERLSILLGDNEYKVPFVELIGEYE